MPPNDVVLLKLVWHPDDIADDTVLPTAFKKYELSGQPGDHVSVDRSDLAKRDCMEAVAENQKKKANAQVKREDAFIGRLHCGSARTISYNEAPALCVVSVPIDGNDAHCGIQNITAENGRGYLNEVRGKLAKLASPPVTFDVAYRDAS